MEKSDNTIYEVSYLLLPTVAVEQVDSKVEALKEMLKKAGGSVISDENPVLIDLAYQMTKVVGTTRHKANSAYFGWVKFEVGKDELATVKKSLDNNDEVLRYLIVKTVRENTLLNGKMMLKKEDKIKKEPREAGEEDVVSEEVSVKEPVLEDLDKSIDDLVIV